MSNFDRKFPILLLAVACLIISLQPMALSANTYWTVAPVFRFYATDSGGSVRFVQYVRMYGWYWSGGLVRFQQLNMGEYVYSELGFSCSSPASIVVQSANKNEIQYIVTAAAGITSTTQVSVPVGFTVFDVDNADGWGFSAGIVTVTVAHTSPRKIILYLRPVSGAFAETRRVWANVFMLIVFLASVGLISGLIRGELGGGSFILKTIIALVAGTATLFILLNVVESLA